MTRVIKLPFTEKAGCLFIDKIAGLPTHSPEYGRRGCVEIYERNGTLSFVVAP
ncbi:MAG: hypothetical protein AAGB31_03675, partial [Bdellovibrio sp.]